MTTPARNSPANASDVAMPLSLRSAGWLAGAAALGALLMAVAHLGVDVPLLPTQGLGRAVPVAAAIFTVGAVLFTAVAWGLRSRARWAWWLGLAGFLFALRGSAMPWRGVGSAVGVILSLLGIGALVMASSRRAVRR